MRYIHCKIICDKYQGKETANINVVKYSSLTNMFSSTLRLYVMQVYAQ